MAGGAALASKHEPDAGSFVAGAVNLRALRAVLPRLAGARCTTPELLALAPELVCRLGFDRALVSRVTDDAWPPEVMHSVGEPEWAAEIGALGMAASLPLAPGMRETPVVLPRQAILVRDAPGRRRCAPGSLLAVSKIRAYVAAPIRCEDKVVGILHADRYGSGRDVDELDRDLLAVFADALHLALTRAAVTEHLVTAEQALSKVCLSLGAVRAEIHRASLLGVGPPADNAPGAGSFDPGRDPQAGRRLPDNLTPRELEVLALIARGRTNLAIAHELYISDGTVKQHVKHILRKLRATNRSEAVVRWFQAGGT